MKRQTAIRKIDSHSGPGNVRTVASAATGSALVSSERVDAELRLLPGSFFACLLCPLCILLVFSLGLFFEARAAHAQVSPAKPVAAPARDHAQELRIRILDAAIVSGPVVLMGEIAQPVGEYDGAQWQKIAATELWESPGVPKRPVTMSRQRLQQAMAEHFPKLSDNFIYPNTLALQRGGALLVEQDLAGLTVKTLTPVLAALGGEATMQDYRLPAFVFLSHPQQRAELEVPTKLSGGRITLRFLVKEPDDTIVKKVSGSVFLDYWKEVPCATQPLNKEDLLDPARVTFVRKNMAYLREEPWDGKGGHLRLVRPVGTNQVIYQNDVAQVPFIRKGNTLTLLYEGKTFQVSVRGEAMSDGFPGDNIPVRNLQSNKQVFATVRDQQTVIVK